MLKVAPKALLNIFLLLLMSAAFCCLYAFFILVACNMHIHCIAVAGWFDVIYVVVALCIQNMAISVAFPHLMFKIDNHEYLGM